MFPLKAMHISTDVTSIIYLWRSIRYLILLNNGQCSKANKTLRKSEFEQLKRTYKYNFFNWKAENVFLRKKPWVSITSVTRCISRKCFLLVNNLQKIKGSLNEICKTFYCWISLFYKLIVKLQLTTRHNYHLNV